ncbi:hypothetical protein CDAR_23761 [Caerostris darwini]|uniref:Uncharacterized protein n=1 Tax=Caerostris darwini TaxID=1538125 RepID=A0AAV4TZE1_9ARAC|nr:hypothetical protein CDAR_23761 [Caerostris darwini]
MGKFYGDIFQFTMLSGFKCPFRKNDMKVILMIVKALPIHHQFPAFPDFQIYFRIPRNYGQWRPLEITGGAPGIIILRFEADQPTTDLRNWETKGVEGRCSSMHQMDRREIPHSNLSHKLPENELAREVADFQELMECLMVLSGVALVIEYSFSLSGQMDGTICPSSSLDLVCIGQRLNYQATEIFKALIPLITGPRVRCLKSVF